jgi:hypothetical protein
VAVYVLYLEQNLKVKVSMERTFILGDKFRFDGKDCVVESTKPEPHLDFTRVYLTAAPAAVIELDTPFRYRPSRKRSLVTANE